MRPRVCRLQLKLKSQNPAGNLAQIIIMIHNNDDDDDDGHDDDIADVLNLK